MAACAATALVATLGVGAAASAQTPSFTLLGYPQGLSLSRGTGISSDGRVAVGYLDGAGQPGFMWTREGGRSDFGITVGATRSAALGISGDGRYAVGGGLGTPSTYAFRWSEAGGYQTLEPGPTHPFLMSEAYDASFDGSVATGMGHNSLSGGDPWPMRWTSAGPEVLGTNVNGYGRAVSGDGRTIVGDAVFPSRAFVWTQAGGMQFLTALDGSISGGLARAVNFDGSIIVGISAAPSGARPATMWINGVPHELFSNADYSFTPSGVSDDGSVVCGGIQAGGGALFPGVWTPSTGVIPLADYFASNGVVVSGGHELAFCRSVSSDGRTFVGDTRSVNHIEAFVATIPSPGSVSAGTLAALLASRRRRNSTFTRASQCGP